MKSLKLLPLLLLVTMLFCTIASAEKNELLRTITVNGTGALSVPADQATIYIGIETMNKDAHEAERENAVIAKKIQDNLLAYGINQDKITTDHYSFYPVYNNDTGKRNTITGYTVNNSVSVTIDNLTKVSDIIDSSIRLGANKINSIQFSVKSTDTLRHKALQLAVQNAKAKAQTMADSLSKKIINVVSVAEGSTAISGLRANKFALSSAGAFDATTPIQSGNVDVNANIEITFEIQ